MSTVALQHNIGAFIALASSVLPQAASASVNGSGLDRAAHNGALSCVLHAATGAITGSPTTTSVTTKLQHSADNSTWADYVAPGAAAVAATSAITAASTDASVAIDLSSANRYIRAVSTIAFTGGSSPTVQVAADIAFGGETLRPAV
ncbi:MAG: hypothetical protein KGJ57_17440 [Sphingomonadales bacterium]|nr:hypothetical protein [Sphingomonadales bacterium]MDE2171182.1 hypothetical protein [Sphingomonadales bacterium]